MELNRSICSREMQKCDVVDSSGTKVGNINDLTFTFDGTLKLSQFILAGSAWEEFLEAIKVRPDKDPIFNASLIDKIGDKIHLNTTGNTLKTTLDECAISDNEIRLSDLKKLDIYDEAGVKIGRVIDVDFDVDGSASLTVGGGFIEEKLEALGLKADIDIIVPDKAIVSIGDDIRLGVSKDELDKTMEEAVQDQSSEIRRARDDKAVHHDVSKVRLFSQRPF
ncbi:MAG: PRC-barrel domain-containing protein [Candidatus Thorarchaeota archaeon]